MRTLAILLATTLTAHAQVPQCVRVATGQTVDCYEPAKIEEAYQTLKRRGIRTSHGYIISIEMNRGKFESAKALADWIECGDAGCGTSDGR